MDFNVIEQRQDADVAVVDNNSNNNEICMYVRIFRIKYQKKRGYFQYYLEEREREKERTVRNTNDGLMGGCLVNFVDFGIWSACGIANGKLRKVNHPKLNAFRRYDDSFLYKNKQTNKTNEKEQNSLLLIFSFIQEKKKTHKIKSNQSRL